MFRLDTLFNRRICLPVPRESFDILPIIRFISLFGAVESVPEYSPSHSGSNMRLVFSSDTPEPGGNGQFRAKPRAARLRHTVQFYESDAFLVRVASDYVLAGLQAAETAIVILTAEHRETLARELSARGIDLESVRARGELIELDAHESLRAFMVDGMPNEERFFAAVPPILERAEGRGASIRAFGEMVNILWSEGRAAAALALEELWNRLRESHPMSILCGYWMRGFANPSDRAFVSSLCGIHDAVVPTERYVEADERTRLVEIVLLQQQAEAMKSELRRREALETTVQQALIDRHRPPGARR